MTSRALSMASIFVACLACSSGGTASRISLELATAPASGNDGDACAVSEETLPPPPEVACVGISVCASGDGGACVPVALARPDQAHAPPYASELRIAASASAPLVFDAMSEAGPHEIHVTAYSATGAVVATGVQRNVLLTQSDTPVVVRLERVGRWSCGPRTAAGTPVAPRALGAAAALPGGEVLLFGGVQGIVDKLGFRPGTPTGAILQRSVEVYDPATQRVRTLLDGSSGLGRVLFASVVAPGAAPPYHVYVYGGYTVTGDSTSVLLLDSSQTGTPVGSPVVPTTAAMPAPPVMITYDPTSGNATIEPLTLTSVPDSGFEAVSDYDPSSGHAFLVLGAGAWTGTMETTTYLKQVWVLGTDGHIASGFGSINLQGGRLGTSVTQLGSDTGIVFGGTAGEATAQRARDLAAEVVNVRTMPTAVAGGGTPHDCATAATHTPTEVPDPAAFHTATRVAGGVLLAGGLLVGGQDCPRLGVTTLMNPRPLVFLSVPASLTGLTGVDVPTSSGTAFTPVVFHTATALTADEAHAGAVLLVGGATRASGSPFVLEPVGQTGIVAPAAGSPPFAYTAGPSLAIARWGHATARLPGGRILVAGGFGASSDAMRLRALDSVEVLPLAPQTALPGGTCTDALFASDSGMPPADGGPMDAARPDAAATDAGPHDAGPVDAPTGG